MNKAVMKLPLMLGVVGAIAFAAATPSWAAEKGQSAGGGSSMQAQTQSKGPSSGGKISGNAGMKGHATTGRAASNEGIRSNQMSKGSKLSGRTHMGSRQGMGRTHVSSKQGMSRTHVSSREGLRTKTRISSRERIRTRTSVGLREARFRGADTGVGFGVSSRAVVRTGFSLIAGTETCRCDSPRRAIFGAGRGCRKPPPPPPPPGPGLNRNTRCDSS